LKYLKFTDSTGENGQLYWALFIILFSYVHPMLFFLVFLMEIWFPWPM